MHFCTSQWKRASAKCCRFKRKQYEEKCHSFFVPSLQAFRWFLRSEFSEENLAFWLACEEYKSMPETKLSSKAQLIYTLFINADAPQEVNLDGETREALMDRMDAPAADTFAEAQQRIFTLMAKDSFPRFLHSTYYKQAVRGA
ncbi:regulator of G-protein signaling 5-like [Silurus asotus]|uniref:Regulator of G-protein signaling 5-like n=1 Tax=Silurus asotus TaxID=30991 RepID=A0AAD5F8K7_SILAS|nr:regulator of G-protein signaling 5-like [Silurus asotus]